MSGKLTLKRVQFVDAYLGEAYMNGAKAAELAGYNGDANALAACASRLLREECVKAYIEQRQKALLATEVKKTTRTITPEEIVELLVDFATDPESRKTHRLRAIENLCKIFGMNKQNISIEADLKVEQTRREVRGYLQEPSVAEAAVKLEQSVLGALPEPTVIDVESEEVETVDA
jgi:hypothetical protein